MKFFIKPITVFFLCFVAISALKAENGYKLWLRNTPITNSEVLKQYKPIISGVSTSDTNLVVKTAASELVKSLSEILRTPIKSIQVKASTAPQGIVIGIFNRLGSMQKWFSDKEYQTLKEDGFLIKTISVNNKKVIVITAKNPSGVLYGAFHFIRLIQLESNIASLNVLENPSIRLRMVNHWDNLNGSIERGYAGKSFFNWDQLPITNQRITDYARMLASIHINATVINNVNASPLLLTEKYILKYAGLAAELRKYGIALYISANFGAPITIGKLNTADPLDNTVQQWWKMKVQEIYHHIPDFGGFLVKASTEGMPGPDEYGRTHADGANALAKALKPYHKDLKGWVIWRTFVQHEWDQDRAKKPLEKYGKLNGLFDENVILQSKNGPVDFQVREAVSPIFAHMDKTNQAIEFQIAQEYTGQQRHINYLLPQWKEVLDFNTYAKDTGAKISDIVTGSTFNRKIGCMTGVINTGADSNWCGHHLAQANLYGFGLLAWKNSNTPEKIAEEWVKLTFGNKPAVVKSISEILMKSYDTYDKYLAPFGIGFMVGYYDHFNPKPSELSSWNYHKSDTAGIGYDRTLKSGSGYTQQYFEPRASLYENIHTCPEERLAFFHHVPYRHTLKNGKTVIQSIYDNHYQGIDEVKQFLGTWQNLHGLIDEQRYQEVFKKIGQQISDATLWGNEINNYYYYLSGLEDEKNRFPDSVKALQPQENFILRQLISHKCPIEKGYETENESDKIIEKKAIEAENGYLFDGLQKVKMENRTIVQMKISNKTAIRKPDFEKNLAIYKIEIPYGKKHGHQIKLSLRSSNPDKDTLWVKIDHLPFVPWVEIFYSKDFNWKQVPGNPSLFEGVHTIFIKFSKPGIEIDQMVVYRDKKL